MQLHGSFTSDDTAAQMPYLHSLSVTHLFCSPILRVSPGSTHGYDVVGHFRISEECGGEETFRRLSQVAHKQGIGVVVDVVPNHMMIPTPIWHSRTLWDMLRYDPESTYAEWFDLDMTDPQAILMPMLGSRIGRELEHISFTTGVISGEEQSVVAYYDQVFPVRPGTEDLLLDELLEGQWYRLAYWRTGSKELNYRRFFDVDTLAAIRTEDPTIFEATHRRLVQLHTEGLIDGFHIDYIDGLANSRQYLVNLQRATGGCWVVAEKILEYNKALLADFGCAGTTGYDSLLRVAGLFYVPGSAPRLTDLWERISGSDEGFVFTILNAKRIVVKESLLVELNRSINITIAICDSDIRLRDHTRHQLSHATRELLYQFSCYHAYVEPGRTTPESGRGIIVETATKARKYLTIGELGALDFIVTLALGETGETDMGGTVALPVPSRILNQLSSRIHNPSDLRAKFMVHFAQTCGPVMAKLKEGTAFYRWSRFIGINETGSDPDIIGINQDDFHGFCHTLAADWSTSMTTLSIHDAKRSGDVRARPAVLAEYPREWEHCVGELRVVTSELCPALLDGGTELPLWQTLTATQALPSTTAGAEAISADHLARYLAKTVRESKLRTNWTSPDKNYESAIIEFTTACLTTPSVRVALDVLAELTFPSARANTLGQELIQLAMSRVPDLYQGCKMMDLSLMDPDDHRPIDYYRRSEVLTALDMNPLANLGAEKLLVTSRALLLCHDHPEAFRGPDADYRSVSLNTGHAVVFERGYRDSETPVAITVATRVQSGLNERGWGDMELVLPNLRFHDILAGHEYPGDATPLADILNSLPVALLVHQVG